MNLRHARVLSEAWRRKFNEATRKKCWFGLAPAVYARQLAMKAVTVKS
jgi:hypothetical protein